MTEFGSWRMTLINPCQIPFSTAETPSKSREDNDRQETEQPRYDIDSHVYISQEATDGQNLDPMEKTLKKETDRDNQPGENEEGAIYHISATKKEIFSTSNNFFNVFANPAEGNSKTSLPAATGVMNGSYRKKNAQDKEDEWLKRMCETQEANESKVSN